ncbi:hypothetical protein DITRI_Ditri07aG0089400 [Diplodiscus trichospermus]
MSLFSLCSLTYENLFSSLGILLCFVTVSVSVSNFVWFVGVMADNLRDLWAKLSLMEEETTEVMVSEDWVDKAIKERENY